MKIEQITKSIIKIDLKRVIELYEDNKVVVVEKSAKPKGLHFWHPTKGGKLDIYG